MLRTEERVRSLLADSGEGETYEAPRSDSDTFPMSQAVWPATGGRLRSDLYQFSRSVGPWPWCHGAGGGAIFSWQHQKQHLFGSGSNDANRWWEFIFVTKSPGNVLRCIIIKNIIYIFLRVFNFNPQSQRQFKEPYSLDWRSAGGEQWSGFVWSCGAPLSCHWSCGSPGICWENSEKLLEFGSWHGEKSW